MVEYSYNFIPKVHFYPQIAVAIWKQVFNFFLTRDVQYLYFNYIRFWLTTNLQRSDGDQQYGDWMSVLRIARNNKF